MNISSRTPKGQPNLCPVCKSEVLIEPSHPVADVHYGDAPCPNCGTLLWFIYDEAGSRLHRADEIEALAKRVVHAFGRARGTEQAGRTSGRWMSWVPTRWMR